MMNENKLKELNQTIIEQERKINHYEKSLNRIANRPLAMYLTHEDAALNFKRIARNALSDER